MRRTTRGGLLIVLCLIVVAGLVLAGCGKKEKALQQPDLEFTSYNKGNTVDFDDATLNSMADGGGESGFKYGLMKSIYPTLYNTNMETVAQALFPAPYWRGDGVHTYYSFLTSADKTAVDGTIFATKLSAAEQANVNTAVEGFFTRVDNDRAAAKAPANTAAYAILKAGAGEAAANAWAADVAAGKDYADRFFVHLVKQFVTAFPDQFAPFWVALFGYTTPPTSPSDAEIEAVARVAGETSFKNGIAGSMYPTQREEKAQSMYTKAYTNLNVIEKSYVDAEVYASLPTAFGSGAMADATRGAIRNSMAASLKAYYGLSSDNYTLLKGVEKAMVDQAVGAQLDKKDATYGFYTKPLGFGPHLEKDYVDFSALTGAVLGWGSELGGALPWAQNMAYLALSAPPAGTVTAAKNFVTDVEAGVLLRQAFYRWLAKEKVKETASAALLIQQSVGEFYFKVTNPNKYVITIDEVVFHFQTTAGASSNVIDGARAILQTICVPAEGEIILKVLAPTKAYDLISWLVMDGKDSNTARAMASEVFSKIQAGTIVWTYTADAQVSSADETQEYSYPV